MIATPQAINVPGTRLAGQQARANIAKTENVAAGVGLANQQAEQNMMVGMDAKKLQDAALSLVAAATVGDIGKQKQILTNAMNRLPEDSPIRGILGKGVGIEDQKGMDTFLLQGIGAMKQLGALEADPAQGSKSKFELQSEMAGTPEGQKKLEYLADLENRGKAGKTEKISELGQLILEEKKMMIDDPNNPRLKDYTKAIAKLSSEKAAKTPTPSAYMKYINEANALEEADPGNPHIAKLRQAADNIIKDHPDFRPDDKTVKYLSAQYAVTGKHPYSGMKSEPAQRMKSRLVTQSTKMLLDAGINPAEVENRREDIKAHTAAIKKGKVSELFMDSFVSNMDAQIERVRTLVAEIKQNPVASKHLNKGLNWWKEHVLSDPDLALYRVHIAEIVRETSKLAQNAQQSVAASTDSETAAWDKMMSSNMEAGGMLKLLGGIQVLSHGRLEEHRRAVKRAENERQKISNYLTSAFRKIYPDFGPPNLDGETQAQPAEADSTTVLPEADDAATVTPPPPGGATQAAPAVYDYNPETGKLELRQ